MKKWGLLLVIGVLGWGASAHFVADPECYAVFFSKGTQWDPAQPFKKQKAIGEHVLFVKKLYHDQKILIAGSFKEQSDSMLLLQDMTLEQAEKRLKEDPAIRNQVLAYQLKPLTVTMFGKLKKTHRH